ncbi:DEKNAAC104048 [Brettanomyces naardenensis]|uniref:Cation-transporting ATPase n=1 Tax=Brettanomyces naardenensis TaxID=13370 RepID=A0A448YQ26_BRENA|nr:DEKNAAC104048 [Brettanomyces naardenensis]
MTDDSPEIRKYEPQAHRVSTDSNAATSAGTSSLGRTEENETEMFSGAASQVVPSSISRFHHHVHSIKSPSMASMSPRMSHGESFLLDEPYDEQGQGLLGLERVDTEASQFSERANFRFFTTDEIESAKGVSSLRRTTATTRTDSVPVDYDTNWNTFEDDYDDNSVAAVSEDETSRLASPKMGIGSADYGSTDSNNDDQRGYTERRLTYDAEEELVREQETEDESVGNFQKVDVSCHDQLFLPKFPARNHSQRFYLAEEDLVIGIAGYRISRIRQLLYYLFVCATLGLGYLFLRWLPRYRIRFLAEPAPEGKSEQVVIEDEYGLLDIVPVQRIWYNKRLSTFLPVERANKEVGEESTSKDPEEEQYSSEDTDPIIPVLIYFEYRYMKFFYDPRDDLFKLSNNWVDERWCHYPDIKDGIPEGTHKARRNIFGPNLIQIKEKSIFALLRDEILHPFYAFQIFSILLWLSDNYYYYAFCIFIISVFSIVESLIETRTTMERLRKLAIFQCIVRVWRNGFWKEVPSEDLVPGDIYEVSDPSLSLFPCDSILLGGDCIVNESMLTGESVPVSKVSISPESVKNLKAEFNSAKFSSHFARSFLYNGTKIVRCRYSGDGPATALVIRTGFNTTKGALVRSMLFPKPSGFKFYEDSFKYIGVMGIIACTGFIFSIANFVKLGVETKTIILRALDIVTIVVPPALPATLTIGTSFALSRLRKKNIFCIAPTRLNVGGKLDVACFDKTGTLTEEGLDVMGVHISQPIRGRKAHEFTEIYDTTPSMMSSDANEIQREELFSTMLSCHSLKLIGDELVGDPLDAKMFEFTHSELIEEPSEDDGLQQFIDSHRFSGTVNPVLFKSALSSKVLFQVKEFEFISQLRRMSVICQTSDTSSPLNVYVKGAPEVMEGICLPESIPSNFHELLYHYTHSGYRVIACATKKMKNPNKKNPSDLTFLAEIPREKCESDLEFIGFIIFENRLKKATTGALKELREAGLRTVMCTGDNILTAVSVAKECGLVDPADRVYVASFNYDDLRETLSGTSIPPIIWSEVDNPDLLLDPTTLAPLDINQDDNYTLAVSGDVFKFVLTELTEMEFFIEKMLMKGAVFARMSPDEKHELVDRLRSLDYTVGFCGDGANDCGALKAADVGISLSEAEASVAAPFTSRIFEISCVLDVIKEGRASLVTSFSCFQYMSLYSAIQFVSVSILYKEGVNLGDFQFLYIDLFLIIPIAVFMSWSKAYPTLCEKRPTANLISPKILIPLLGCIVIEAIFQVSAWRIGKKPDAPWYVKAVPGNDEEVKCTDNTVVFFFSNFQYIFAALMLTVGPPYREPATKNEPFIFTIVSTVLFSIVLMIIDPKSSFGNLMDLTWLPRSIESKLIIGALINYVVLEIGDKYLFVKLARLYKKLFGSKKSKKKFKNLRREFKSLNEA